MYSGIEAGEEMVEPFSQSLSPLRAIDRPGDLCRDGECERLEASKKHFQEKGHHLTFRVFSVFTFIFYIFITTLA